ncbi:MAG: DUF1345 domain-containing protein [Candidatus Saccharimonadales bacterium]
MKRVKQKQTRFTIAVVAALVAGLISSNFAGWSMAALVGWDIGAITLLSVLWYDFSGHNAERTATIAKRDDMNHSVIDIVLLAASIASIAAVGALLFAGSNSGNRSWLIIGFGLVSIIISWATVHSIFMLRYASLYYRDNNKGVDFSGSDEPKFSDFAYLAFTIGMTYQVSDTTFKTSEFRSAALRHALLSFLFGTAIIATTINFIASLAK